VEHRLREDIEVYESHGLTPYQVGMRIWQHPTMQVTNPLKRRFTSSVTLSQSYSLALEQTFKFPLHRLESLAVQAERNLIAVKDLISRLGASDATYSDDKGPVWTGISPMEILEFLRRYQVDSEIRSFSLPLLCAYIEKLVAVGELAHWTIAVRGRQSRDPVLGVADWGLPGGAIAQISRSRIGETDSLGVITSPGDETVCLSEEMKQRIREQMSSAQAAGDNKSENRIAREIRNATEGLLLLYPISRYSGHDLNEGNRRPLYSNPAGPSARDLVGLALSFPKSEQSQSVEAFIQGTVGWRPIE